MRIGSRASLLLALGWLAVATGCSHFEFSHYRNLDDWYVGRDHIYQPQWGFTPEQEEGCVMAYYTNDAIRTPAAVTHDVSRILVSPIAAVYYGVCCLMGGDEVRGAEAGSVTMEAPVQSSPEAADPEAMNPEAMSPEADSEAMDPDSSGSASGDEPTGESPTEPPTEPPADDPPAPDADPDDPPADDD